MDSRTAVRQEYNTQARQYDQEWSYYIEATTRQTLERLPLGSASRVLDVGCGTGALLSALDDPEDAHTLVGIDFSVEMLRQARKKLCESVSLAAGAAELIPLASDQFDVVVSANVFHFLSEPRYFLQEARRVLVPGGEVVITDWCDDYWACWCCDHYLRWVNEGHTRMFGSADLEAFLREEGFQDVRLETYKIDWLWGLMTARAKLGT